MYKVKLVVDNDKRELVVEMGFFEEVFDFFGVVKVGFLVDMFDFVDLVGMGSSLNVFEVNFGVFVEVDNGIEIVV